MTFRDIVKSTVENGVLWSGIPRAMRAGRRGDALVLAYHNIVPDGLEPSGDISLHLPRARFAMQLDALARTHDIISLERALAGERGARPSAVITFDDAYQGAVSGGVAELSARGLPATIFVATAFVNGRDFWWDALTVRGADAPAPTLRARALDECTGEDACIRALAASEMLAAPTAQPPHARGASERELGAAVSLKGISLGSHTHGHPNLARLTGDALRAELEFPLAWLRERFADVLPVISYPYGLSSPAVERAASRAGYTAGLRIDGGWLTRREDNAFALPRLDVPSRLSHSGFELRTAGVLSR